VVVPYGRQDENGGNAAVSLKVVELEDEVLDEVGAKKSLRWQIGVVANRLRVSRPPRLAWVVTPVVLVLGYVVLKCAG
jgi:hypothetical protein